MFSVTQTGEDPGFPYGYTATARCARCDHEFTINTKEFVKGVFQVERCHKCTTLDEEREIDAKAGTS